MNLKDALQHEVFSIISKAAKELNFETYVIGGYVRDYLLKRPCKDIDFVQYDWNRKFFNRVREGDYFLYRRPQKVSENKKFYFSTGLNYYF